MNAGRETLQQIDRTTLSGPAPGFPLPGSEGEVRPSTASSIHNDPCPPNIVLFGETGVGKSSLINLIAGQELAQTSNDALGCTAEPQKYSFDLPLPRTSNESETGSEPITVSLWDTAGLDEGTQGTVPNTISITHLQSLLQKLARSPAGIHLLIFCIRGTSRLTQALSRQYHLVYDRMCRKRVRIVLVVTGLEHQYLGRPVEMETWWEENEGFLKQLGMGFDRHACVTTVDQQEGVGRERILESQRRLRELVVEFIQPHMMPWKIERPLGFKVISILLGFLCIRGSYAGRGRVKNDPGIYRFCAVLVQWVAAKFMPADYKPAEGELAVVTDDDDVAAMAC